jgi:Putative prokaryotic signal transducing protein
VPADWVTVAKIQNEQEYLLARARLESAGIECFSPNENMARISGAIMRLWDGFILQVPAENAEDAMSLLNDPGGPFLVSE